MVLAPEKQLFQDSDLLQSIIEISSVVIWIDDLTSNKRKWLASATLREKYNLPVQDVGSTSWQNNIHPDDATVIEEIVRVLSDNATTLFTCIYRFRGKNNAWHYISDKIQITRDEKGNAIRAMGAWTDVTSLKEKEQENQNLLLNLNTDLNRFKVISEFSNSVMWEVDLITNQIFWTSGIKTLEDFGLTKSGYTIEDWEKSIHPEDAPLSAARFYEAIQSRESTYFDEYRFIKPNGSLAYVVDRGIIIRDSNDKPVKVVGGWIDLTTLRERERELANALKKQEKLFKELAGSEAELQQANQQLNYTNKVLSEREELISRSQQLAKIGNWQHDPVTGNFTFSEEIYNIFGINQNEDISTVSKILEFYDVNTQERIQKLFSHRNEPKPFDYTVQLTTPLGKTKWVRVYGWPVLDPNFPYPRIYGLTYDVTYFKEAEELLRSSEQKFSRAFHNNADLMVLMRKEDWVFIDVNEKIASTLGYTRKELLGVSAKSFTFFVNQHEREHFFSKMELENFVEMEAELFCKDKTIKHALLTFNTIESSREQHIIATIKDITDRKAAEEKFIKAFELSPDLMLIFRESDYTLVECNSKVESMGGYQRNEIMGKCTTQFNLWQFDEDRKRHNKTYFESGGTVTMESTFIRKDRSIFYGAISTRRIMLASQPHMLVNVRDITERKISEQKLLQSEANLYATINNTNLLVWSIDLDYQVIKVNQPFIEYVKKHYNATITQGQRITPPDPQLAEYLRKIWVPRYERALKGEQYKITELYDNLYVEHSISPIVDNDKIIGISVFAEDVTNRVEQEQALKDAVNKIAELRLTMLRSVMNPHFIFNALNSIQFFIAQNDRRNAISYLSTFSRLVRGILAHSVSNKISLREETEQLKHYIALEQIRFENKFDFNITIDPELDQDTVEIPPLLIQPYVENAILHGLYNKVGKGNLSIRILKEADAILCEVEDDGVGRTLAQEIRKKNFPGHKSMGTALTEERLRLINTQYQVSFEIQDLSNSEGIANGTLVRLWLNR